MPVLIPPMYNLFKSVGKGGDNARLDVMLVQYFLFSINMNSGWETSRHVAPNPGPGGASVIFPHDGVYRPELAEWIRNFQQSINRTELGPVVADGRVDPVKVGWGNKRINVPNKRTIQAFNQVLWRADGDRFLRLSTDPSLPAALAAEFKVMRMEV